MRDSVSTSPHSRPKDAANVLRIKKRRHGLKVEKCDLRKVPGPLRFPDRNPLYIGR